MTSRLPRFSRSPEISPIQVTPRDRKIIQLIHRHRFLRSSHLIALIEDSSQPLLRRLQLLYHHGYLERPRAQLDYYHQGGSREIVYGLGNKGAKLLSRELGVDVGSIRWGEKSRSVGRVYLEHVLLVSDVMVSIELACRQNGTIRLLNEEALSLPVETQKLGRPFRWRVNVDSQLKLGIVPDRVFALEYLDLGGALNRTFFFLEADRGTMPVKRHNLSQTSFYRKLLAYGATWSQSVHRTRFGFHRFQVLTVTTSAERVRSLVDACSGLSHGHGLFLFTDRHTLQTSKALFRMPWQNTKQGQARYLLESHSKFVP